MHVTKCYACGAHVSQRDARPFGRIDGRVRTWVCPRCSDAPLSAAAVGAGGPLITWTTIAKANLMLRAGYGRSVNDVLQRGLLTLENGALTGNGARR